MADNADTPDVPLEPGDELTPQQRASMEKELQAYQQALESEFNIAQEKHPEETVENTLNFFKGHVPMACAQIAWLMQNSTSDSTRLAAGKYIIDRVFKGMVDSPEDPVKDILSKLMAGESIDVAPAESPHE